LTEFVQIFFLNGTLNGALNVVIFGRVCFISSNDDDDDEIEIVDEDVR
jgi:hypothetical protein